MKTNSSQQERYLLFALPQNIHPCSLSSFELHLAHDRILNTINTPSNRANTTRFSKTNAHQSLKLPQ